MPFIEHDGLRFHYRERGQGTTLIFQHGLGGDVNQPFGLFVPPAGFRLLAFDCRGHGETRPLGSPDRIGLAAFADDLRALMLRLNLSSAILGGISMGAAVALNFALRFPQHVLGLVLSRPAWLDQPMSQNVQIYGTIASLIRQHGAKRGLELFKQTGLFADILHQSPDSANSLIGQFEQPRAEETVVKLERIPQDAPSRDRREWAAITVPTLVLASRQDPIHPFEYGEQIARIIPDAEFKEITPKSVSKERHTADVQTAIAQFLKQHFAEVSQC